MIQILGFSELLFSLDWHLRVSNSKNGAWWEVYFLMLIFWLFSFWTIKSADLQNYGSNPKSELDGSLRNTVFKLDVWFCEIFIWLLSERMTFVRTWKYAFCISTMVLWTLKTQVLLHSINSWISFILEIPACIFSLWNLCHVQFLAAPHPKDGHKIEKKASPMTRPGEGFTVIYTVLSNFTASKNWWCWQNVTLILLIKIGTINVYFHTKVFYIENRCGVASS